MSAGAGPVQTDRLMEPEEPKARSPLQAAKEPLSLRFLIAFSTATVLTAAVVVPMAFQAHLAREEQRREPSEAEMPVVLGATTVPADLGSQVHGDGLFAVGPDGGRVPLDDAVVDGSVQLLLDLPGAVRADFVLDDRPVVTDREHPLHALPSDARGPVELAPGPHLLTATVTFADGHLELVGAEFTVAEG